MLSERREHLSRELKKWAYQKEEHSRQRKEQVQRSGWAQDWQVESQLVQGVRAELRELVGSDHRWPCRPWGGLCLYWLRERTPPEPSEQVSDII